MYSEFRNMTGYRVFVNNCVDDMGTVSEDSGGDILLVTLDGGDPVEAVRSRLTVWSYGK